MYATVLKHRMSQVRVMQHQAGSKLGREEGDYRDGSLRKERENGHADGGDDEDEERVEPLRTH